jgi:hypothetical protein
MYTQMMSFARLSQRRAGILRDKTEEDPGGMFV